MKALVRFFNRIGIGEKAAIEHGLAVNGKTVPAVDFPVSAQQFVGRWKAIVHFDESRIAVVLHVAAHAAPVEK